jgi:hypothetical protein
MLFLYQTSSVLGEVDTAQAAEADLDTVAMGELSMIDLKV